MVSHRDGDVVGFVFIEYGGTTITKSIRLRSRDDSTDATNVVRVMDMLSRHVQAMSQADQFARTDKHGKPDEESPY